MAFAEGTTVAFEKSVAEIVTLVKCAGANRVAQADTPESFGIQFFMRDRMIRFRVALPLMADMPTRDGRGVALDKKQRESRLQQAIRQRGRALLLVIKAKLESVESHVETFEEAFLANVVMPDGKTVGQHALPTITQAYADGQQPPLMLPTY
jgi:hypothetical protein